MLSKAKNEVEGDDSVFWNNWLDYAKEEQEQIFFISPTYGCCMNMIDKYVLAQGRTLRVYNKIFKNSLNYEHIMIFGGSN